MKSFLQAKKNQFKKVKTKKQSEENERAIVEDTVLNYIMNGV